MALVEVRIDGRGPTVEPYGPALEPWYVFLHNEGYRGFDAPEGARLLAYPDPPPLRTFLVRDGALYAGFLDLARGCREDGTLAVELMGVLPHYRRRGLGGLLLGAANECAREAGYRRLEAVVRSLDPRVHVFLARHGFEVGALGLEIRRPGGERACIAPGELAREPAGLEIMNLLYVYRRPVT
jgi:GNAT superfamily N-acetyltransferase